MPIPRIIHQVWVGNKKPPLKWIQTWRDKHPTWRHILWDNTLVEKYDFIHKDLIHDLINRQLYHGAADVIRYEAVYDFGGFAMPADSICENPLDDLRQHDFFTCYENEEYYPGRLTPIICAAKEHELTSKIVWGLEGVEVKEPWIDTGNAYLTHILKDTEATILPDYTFMAGHHKGGVEEKGKVYARQFSGTTRGIYE